MAVLLRILNIPSDALKAKEPTAPPINVLISVCANLAIVSDFNTMTETPTEQEAAAAGRRLSSSVGDGGGIMTSIKTVRELLQAGSVLSSESVLNGEISALKQSQFEERIKMEQAIETQQETTRKMKRNVEKLRREAEREKSLRQTLESANDALEEHKKELAAQLDMVSKSRSSLEDVIEDYRAKLEEEKVKLKKEKAHSEQIINNLSLQKEKEMQRAGEWEARFLTLQRQTNELKSEVLSMKSQMDSTKAQHEEVIQRYTKNIQILEHRLAGSTKRANVGGEHIDAKRQHTAS